MEVPDNINYCYEDELPALFNKEVYYEIYPHSVVLDGVRVFPWWCVAKALDKSIKMTMDMLSGWADGEKST